ncbi:MAG: hypothetical protein GY715_00145 [Planctomycetes bacterium]|nr:hypothetical protein [Planctomycetota bacterium]
MSLSTGRTVSEIHDPHARRADGHADDAETLVRQFDAVVAFRGRPAGEPETDELRRFARHLPVLIIDTNEPGNDQPPSTDAEGVTVVAAGGEEPLRGVVVRELRNRRIKRPLLWLVDDHHPEIAEGLFAGLKVYRAQASVLADERRTVDDDARLRRMLDLCDLVVADDADVIRTLVTRCRYEGPSLVLDEVPPAQGGADDGPSGERCFATILSRLASAEKRPIVGTRLNILILYDPFSLFVNTIREYLDSFRLYSRHHYWFAAATRDKVCPLDLSVFDVVIVHYSVRLSLPDHISPSFADALRAFGGLKVLFIQDEYDTPHTTCNWIDDLGIQLVFTCVPDGFVRHVYPEDQLEHVRFVGTLTGFISERVLHLPFGRPLEERDFALGYRGRPLSYWYGELGQEKMRIGQRMREICEAKGIPCDIAWEEEDRIYGDGWYEFLGNCRATLGTESGANVFDWDGTLAKTIRRALKDQPDMTFEEASERFLKDRDGKIRMNQISPKLFEAISLRTALVLFDGEYSGVLEPNRHYIPLRKDFSNVDDVLAQVNDDDRVRELTDCAYEEIAASGRWGYPHFIRDVDRIFEEECGRASGRRIIGVIGGLETDGRFAPVNARFTTGTSWPASEPTPASLLRWQIDERHPWLIPTARRLMPRPVRRVVKPIIQRGMGVVRKVVQRVRPG